MKTFNKILVMFFVMMLGVVGVASAHTIKPTFTPDIASGSTVNPGQRVTMMIEAADEYTAIMECTYSWNGTDTKNIFDTADLKGKEGKCFEIEFEFEKFSNLPGLNILQISATDSYGNFAKKEFRYTVADVEAPKITSSVSNNSTVEAGSSVTVTITDNGELAEIKYNWNTEDEEYILKEGSSTKHYNKFEYTLEKFPNINDTFVLNISARDVDGNPVEKTFTYIVKYNDTTAPTITMSKKSGSIVEAGTKLTMVVEDNESKITSLVYNWENAAEKEVIPSKREPANKCTVTSLTIGSAAGTYRLHVTAINSVGKKTTGVYEYIVKPEVEEDTEKPEVKANPSSGSVKPNATIVLTATDNEELKTLSYKWDNGTSKPETISGKEDKVDVKAPTTAGSHTLSVTVVDANNNSAEKTFKYTVLDEEDPTVEAYPSAGKISPNSIIQVAGKDNEALAKLIYSWDNGAEKTEPLSGKADAVEVKAPATAGKHTLKVTVIDASNNDVSATYTYTILDEEDPTVKANPSSGEILPLARIKVTVTDNESLKTLVYSWDNGKEDSTPVSGKEDAVEITAPTKSGKHTLYVKVIDASNNDAEGKFTYTVVETSKPTVGANPGSGSEIEPQEVIKLTAKDNEELKTLVYKWDNSSEVPKSISGEEDYVDVTAPSSKGEHTLYVTVTDASNNTVKEEFVYMISDTEDPTVTVTPNGGDVDAGDPVKITGKDNEGLDNITYNWDNEEPTPKPVGGKEASIDTEVPTTPGKHVLYVTVEDEDGNKVTDSIEFDVSDDEKPTITMNPKSGSTVKGGKVVKATLKDNVELKKVTYNWEDEDEKTENLDGTSETISLPALPYKEGKYEVIITVEDNAGNKTTGTYTYYVEEDDDEEIYPTVDADPDGGEVEYGDKITVSAEDEDGEIEYVEYYWDDEDDDTTKKYKDEFTVKVPSEEGKHYLYVRAMDDDDNLCDYERFTYYVEENKYPGNSDIIGDLNNRVRALRVEIRNADDKIKFEPEEEILYYVDYYNGTSSDVKNAKLVVDLPTYLEAEEASDNGKVSTKQVTWSLGTLEAGEYGRVSFVAKYTSSKVNEKIITVPAKIYSGSSLKDTSTVRNMIFCEGASGTGSHQAYCVGYPDGTFLAEGKITRAELASMICNIEGISGTHRGQFTDANNHWAASYMQAVVDRGYMIPKSYNRFGAQDYATRADLAYAIASILGVEDLEPIFISATDTQNSDVRCAMEQLLRLGIMDGYSDGSAKPNSNITRAEAVTIINNYLFRGELYTKGYNYAYNFETNYNHGGNNYILRFTDLSTNHWAYGHIMEATNNHRYERVMDGNEDML